MADSYLAGADCVTTDSETRIYSYCLRYLAQSRYSEEGLDPALK